jgi:NADH-quinone oxidoreductase E subunit
VTQHSAEPYVPVFTGETKARLEALGTKYPTRQALLLPALWMIQEARGWVSPEAIVEVAAELGVTPAYVRGVVSFYTMYHTHPVGRHFIQVCTTSPCNICGAEGVVEAFLQHSGCGELGATSPDGRFTVIEVECLGACAFATPVLINDDFLESVTPETVPAILARYP